MFGAASLLVGVAAALALVFLAWSRWQFDSAALTSEGVVTAVKQYCGNDPSRSNCGWVPTVEFKAGGRKYAFDGSVASQQRAYAVGDSVDVRYLPADPDSARIDGVLENWVPFVLAGAVALLFGGYGSAWATNAWKTRGDRAQQGRG